MIKYIETLTTLRCLNATVCPLTILQFIPSYKGERNLSTYHKMVFCFFYYYFYLNGVAARQRGPPQWFSIKRLML